MNKGYTKRSKRRVRVRQGNITFTDSCDIAETAPVADGVTVLSGQLISKDADGAWVLGVPKGKEPFIALKDSIDPDAAAVGLVPAISLAGTYTVETAYFVGTETYNPGTVLIAGTSTNVGSLIPSTGGDFDGAANVDIMGICTAGEINLNPDEGTIVDLEATDSNVIVFRSQWVPARVS